MAAGALSTTATAVIWFDGKLVPWADAKLHVLTHGLHYASCVFEGERAYGGEIFKRTEHIGAPARLGARCSTSRFPIRSQEIDAAKHARAREERADGRLCPPDRLARQRDDGRLGAAQQDPPRHREPGSGRPISIRRSG